ncbi:MAG TPA: hypothetical protein VMK12_20080 [Anaeromyxobacteraceae bacterium]|nr:hypothetical protein [Anaeromyxobacteraceae bacterium]
MSRPCPDSAALRLAFAKSEARRQRRSDGIVSMEGRRFVIPSSYRHLERVAIRYARWDLSQVHLVDERTSKALCRLYPLDKERTRSRPTSAPCGLPRAPVAPRVTHGPAVHRWTPSGLPPQLRRRRTVNEKVLSLYGPKWNPFSHELPIYPAEHLSTRPTTDQRASFHLFSHLEGATCYPKTAPSPRSSNPLSRSPKGGPPPTRHRRRMIVAGQIHRNCPEVYGM